MPKAGNSGSRHRSADRMLLTGMQFLYREDDDGVLGEGFTYIISTTQDSGTLMAT